MRSVGSPAIARSIGVGRFAMPLPAVNVERPNDVNDDGMQAIMGGDAQACSLTGETKVR